LSSDARSVATPARSPTLLTLDTLADAVDLKLAHGQVLAGEGSPQEASSPAVHLPALMWLAYCWNNAEEVARGPRARAADGEALAAGVRQVCARFAASLLLAGDVYPAAQRAVSAWVPARVAAGVAYDEETRRAHERAVLSAHRLRSGFYPVARHNSLGWAPLPPAVGALDDRSSHECMWTLVAAAAGTALADAGLAGGSFGSAVVRVGTLLASDAEHGAASPPPLYPDTLLEISPALLQAVCESVEEQEDGADAASVAAGVAPLPLLCRALMAGLAPYFAKAGAFSLTEADGLRSTFVRLSLLACAVKPLARAVAGCPLLAAGPYRDAGAPPSGIGLQRTTLLGALLSPSALPSGSGLGHGLTNPSPLLYPHFDHVLQSSRAAVQASTASLREAQAGVWEVSHRAVRCLLDADVAGGAAAAPSAGAGAPAHAVSAAAVKPAREATLSWIASVLACNAAKAKEYAADPGLSDDGFMVNLGAVLCRLCEPIWEGTRPLAMQLAAAAGGLGGVDGAQAPDRASVIELEFLRCGSKATEAGAAAARAMAGAGVSSPISVTMLATAPPASGGPFFSDLVGPRDEQAFKPATRLFFCCMRALQLGLGRVIRATHSEERQLGYVARMAREQGGAAAGEGNPAHRRYEYMLANKAALDVLRLHPALLHSAARTCALACEVLTRALFGAYDAPASPTDGFVAACSGSLSWDDLEQKAAASHAVLTIPESYVFCVLDVLNHVATARDILGDLSSAGSMLTDKELSCVLHGLLALLVLPSDRFAASPHLRASIGDVLYAFFVPQSAQPQGDADAADGGRARRMQRDAAASGSDYASHLIAAPSPFVATRLVPALMVLYGAVEATGHYEKSEHRQRVTTFLNFLWGLPAHRAAFRTIAVRGAETPAAGSGAASAEAPSGGEGGFPAQTPIVSTRGDAAEFISFANGLIGHTTTLLSSALEGLPEIKETLALMRDLAAWGALSEEVRSAREQALDQASQTVRGSFLLANETMSLLCVLAEDDAITRRLMSPELVTRLADMLVNALVALAGPRGVKLKVNNPGQYNFRPVEMLSVVVTTLLRLASEPAFVTAVAESGMYKEGLWRKIEAVIRRIGVLPDVGRASSEAPSSPMSSSPTSGRAGASATAGGAPQSKAGAPLTMADFERFREAVAAAALEVHHAATLYADPPDEFVDIILGDLMTDPVVTPQGKVYQRTSILQQLLHKPEDPLTRLPLKAEDLRPAVDVKARIEAWKAERRAAALAAQAAAAAAASLVRETSAEADELGPA
jgi:ubiquitin conjugation factor E4 B